MTELLAPLSVFERVSVELSALGVPESASVCGRVLSSGPVRRDGPLGTAHTGSIGVQLRPNPKKTHFQSPFLVFFFSSCDMPNHI